MKISRVFLALASVTVLTSSIVKAESPASAEKLSTTHQVAGSPHVGFEGFSIPEPASIGLFAVGVLCFFGIFRTR